jgi:hypothetical protein
MITVRIDGQERGGVEPNWIAQTVNGLRHNGKSVCVRVAVKTSGMDVALSAGNCPGGGGGGRPPNGSEARLLELWGECGLGNADFPVGSLISCLRRLEREVA